MSNTILQLESVISDIIKRDNACHTKFDYINGNRYNALGHQDSGFTELKITTYNPKKDETFLLFSIKHGYASGPIPTNDIRNEEDALRVALDWIRSHSEEEYSHTIVWTKKGAASKSFVSYFYAKNAFDALLKFYDGKDKNEYVVYEIKLNPIA